MPPKPRKRKRTSFNLDPDVKKELDQQSKFHGDKTRIVETALKEYLKKNVGGVNN